MKINNFMKKILFVVALLLAMPIVSLAQEKKAAVYFYADWCPHCQKVDAAFKEKGFYDKYDIQKLDFDESNNKKLLKNIFDELKYTGNAGIPAIVVNGKLLVGDGPILNNFEKEIEIAQNKDVEFVNGMREKIGSNSNSSKNIFPIVALIAAAFVDASNPCALAVLVLLLATVINAKGKKSALLSGFMFSLAIFLSYFLMGIGLYKVITAFGISIYLSLGVGILAIILGLANFKDVFWYGKGFIMEVPLSWRPKMQEIIKKATSPWSAFGIGFMVSLFLVPCSSGPYVVILGMLAERVNMGSTLLFLVLYNFIFVLPMILITLGMYFFNTRMGKVEEWRKNNLRFLHAIAGTILLILGIYLIYSRLT